MNLAVPLAGYFLTVLILMFGGRKRRSFHQASHAAASVTVTLLSLGAIVWLLYAIIWHLINAEN
jgi:bacteriorhodopsin